MDRMERQSPHFLPTTGPFARYPTLCQLLGFVATGAIGTSAHFATLICLVQAAGVSAIWSSCYGSIVGALVNYILSYHFVFRSKKHHGPALIQFLTVAVVGLSLNFAVMTLAVNMLGLHYLLSQVLATGTVLFFTFIGNRFWTFR